MKNRLCVGIEYGQVITLVVGTFLSFAVPVWAASVYQHTEGSCSPAVADVKGSVSVVFTEIDPAVISDVVKILNAILKDTNKIDQITLELDRASKRTDRLEVRQASRRVTPNQFAVLKSILSTRPPHPIEVGGMANNIESMRYAEDIALTLQESKWPVRSFGALTVLGQIPIGVHISYKDEDGAAANAKFLAESFRKAGIEVLISEKPKRTSSIIDIMVGFKSE